MLRNFTASRRLASKHLENTTRSSRELQASSATPCVLYLVKWYIHDNGAGFKASVFSLFGTDAMVASLLLLGGCVCKSSFGCNRLLYVV